MEEVSFYLEKRMPDARDTDARDTSLPVTKEPRLERKTLVHELCRKQPRLQPEGPVSPNHPCFSLLYYRSPATGRTIWF